MIDDDDNHPPAPASDVPPAEAPPAAPEGEAPAPATPGEPQRPRRRRRRRGRRPPGAGAPPGEAAIADAGMIGAPIEGAAPAAPSAPGTPGERPRFPRGPRPRRPRRPREGAPQGEGQAQPDRRVVYGPFLPRNWRPRGERAERPRSGEQAARPERRRDDRPHEGFRDRENQRRDRPRGDRPRGPGRGRDEHGRDNRPPRPEPKLVTTEATVDRGFEDVADEASEGQTKRVNWTIVKRTVADQRTAKQVSANYVLKREGADDTEFPSLAAARAAVNKTIVHPEKLTLSKADHAAQRSKSK